MRSNSSIKQPLRVAVISPEVYPFSKTGGLADVIGALPAALVKEGLEVRIFSPCYQGISDFPGMNNNKEYSEIEIGGVKLYFIKHYWYFDRAGYYRNSVGQFPDNLDRFVFFCRRTISLLQELKFAPDIVHIHEWQSCLVAPYIRTIFADNLIFKNTKIVLTIHNVGYQGDFAGGDFSKLGLDSRYNTSEFMEFHHRLNLLKAGICVADAVTTVSPRHALEILTSKFGCGLEGLLAKINDKKTITGILNGIDTRVWNPGTDQFLENKFSMDDLSDRDANKRKLQEELSLGKSDGLLSFVISRLSAVKGIDLVAKSIDSILGSNEENQIVILGVMDDAFERENGKILNEAIKKYPDRFVVRFEHNEELAHKLYGAGDLFLMPSALEPCGLTQMYAMNYAALPLVFPVGGLYDTVQDVDDSGCGFLMTYHSEESFFTTFKRAEEVFYNHLDKWRNLQEIGMNKDFSWSVSAKKYKNFFLELCQK